MSIRIVIEIQNPEELFDNEAPAIGRVLADLGLINRRKAILKGFTKNLHAGMEENGVKVHIEAEDTLAVKRERRFSLRLPRWLPLPRKR